MTALASCPSSPSASSAATRERCSLASHDPGLYLLNVSNVVSFDAERRKTRFEQFCDGCERFRSVAGATPAFLRGVDTPLPDGIYRTDVEFGSDDGRHPVLIVSAGVRDMLRREAKKGVDFKPVEGDERQPA